MPVYGPDYNKHRADEDGKELYNIIVQRFRVMQATDHFVLEDCREELKRECITLMHLFHKYNSYENF